MFNRDKKDVPLESRVADLERVVAHNGEMLDAIRDIVSKHENGKLATSLALGLSLSLLPPEKRAMLESAMSDLLRQWPDREHAMELRAIFEEEMKIIISD